MDHNYPRTAPWLQEKNRKETICEAHDHIFSGHHAAQKNTSSSLHPIFGLMSTLRCSNTHKPVSAASNENLQTWNPLHWTHFQFWTNQIQGSIPTFLDQCLVLIARWPTSCASRMFLQNMRWSHQFLTKRLKRWQVFKNWFCKFGIPAQMHTDWGKEFIIEISAELFELLNVHHSKTSPAHP